MKVIRLPVGFLLFALASLAAFGRDVRPLDAGWRFWLGDVAGAEAVKFDAASWKQVDLPHDWSASQAVEPSALSAGGGGFFPDGTGWYRKTFEVPDSWRGERVLIEFDGVYMNAEVWLNGTRLGQHPYGYTRFRFDLTPHLKFGGKNVVAVRVDNSVQPNCRWYSGSGIYRHVRLVAAAPVRIGDDGIFVRTSRITDGTAAIDVAQRVQNDTPEEKHVVLETRIVDRVGHEVVRTQSKATLAPQSSADVPAELSVKHAELWSSETPTLYRVITRVYVEKAAGAPADEVCTSFGIRTVRVSADRGFELNGRTIKLVGANVHHDNGPLGAAAFDRAEERRVELLKAAGFNAIRTSHNPPSPAFVDACDRLGMLVLEEAFDGWEKGKNPYDYSLVFKDWWQRDLDAMVLRDRNHPSVVLWSIGNEMYERGNASGLRIARELTGRIRELDPSRPVTAGVNGPGKNGDWTKFDPLFATLDVAGYNYELARHGDDHVRVPGRVILVTESYQSETFANWAVIHDTPYVIGDFVWSGMDYLGEAGIGRVFPPGEPIVKHWEGNQFPWHGAACGDIDITGWRKPISHYRQIVWDRGEKLYMSVRTPTANGQPWGVSPWTVEPSLPSWTWPGQEGRDLTVEVCSRFDAVRLYLNGKLIGEKPTTRAQEFKATFMVPYAAGELKAVGLKDRKEADSFTLSTVGAPTQIRLTPDRTMIRADGQDLAFVVVELADAKGRLVPNVDAAVTFSVNGTASIAAVGNADMTSFETYVANPHHTFQGRALIVLRAGRASGSATLTATADGLGTATTTVLVKK